MQPRPDDPDRPAVLRVLGGDADAYGQIVSRHEASLRRVVCAIVGDRDLAEDIIQEVFLIAYRQLATFKGESRLSTWLSRIAVREAVRARSRLRRFTRRLVPLDEACAPHTETLKSPDHLEHVLGLLNRLSQRERAAFVLHVVENRTYDEIAEVLDCRPGTVGSLIHRARKRLMDFTPMVDRVLDARAKTCSREAVAHPLQGETS